MAAAGGGGRLLEGNPRTSGSGHPVAVALPVRPALGPVAGSWPTTSGSPALPPRRRLGLAGRAQAAAVRAAALALLRPLRRRRDQLAAARQLPGRPGARCWRCAPRPPTSGCRCWPPPAPRSSGFISTAVMVEPARAGLRHAGPAAQVPGPLLQLVRPARPARAGAGLHLHRRQRQPGRPPDRPAPGLPADRRRARRSTSGCGAAWSPRSGMSIERLVAGHPPMPRRGRAAGGGGAASGAPRPPSSPARPGRAARPRSCRRSSSTCTAARAALGAEARRAGPRMDRPVARADRPAERAAARARRRSGAARPRARPCARWRRRARRRRPGRTPASLADRAHQQAMEHGLLLPLRPRAQAVRHRLPGGQPRPRRVVLRPAGLRSAAGQLRGHRQERRAGRSLVPPGAQPDPRRRGHRPGLLEREHVRVPDAGAGDAVLSLHPARPDPPQRRPAPDQLRRRARRALGDQRERLQRARPPLHLPVPGLRRPRPGPQARAGPGPGGRALRRRCWPPWSIPGPRWPTCRRSSGWAPWAPTGSATPSTTPAPNRASATPSCKATWPTTSAWACWRWPTCSRTTCGSAAFTPTRWCARPSCCCTSASPGRSSSTSRSGPGPRRRLPDPELDRPAERAVDSPFTPTPRIALLGHVPYTIMISQGGGGYSRYENLAVTRWRADGTRDATGQFCYLKDLASGAVWSAAHQPVCAPGRLVRHGAGHRSGDLPPGGRRDRDAHRGGGGPGRRGRGAAGDRHQQRRQGPGDRADQLRRDRAGLARQRPGPPGLRQPVHRDRVARLVLRGDRHPPAPLRDGQAPVVCPRGRHRRRAGGAGELRDRPGPLHRPRAHDPRPGGPRAGRTAVGHHRGGAGSHLRPAHPAAAAARPVGVGRLHHPGRPHPRAGLRAGRPLRRSARRPARPRPGLDRLPDRAAASCASARATRPCTRTWPATSSTPTRPCARPRRSCCATAARSRCSGRRASRATGRSCWPPSSRPRGCPPCGSSSPPTTTGAGGA